MSGAAFAAEIVGLAAVDALNPFSIAAMAYLLGTPKPTARSGVFVAGTFVTYLAGGFAILGGVGYALARLLPLIGQRTIGGIELAGALLCLVLCVITFRRTAQGQSAFTPPATLSLGATAAFAVSSTLADLPTGAPYIAAALRIATATDNFAGRMLWLLLYNAIYVAPLVLLFAAKLLLGARGNRIVTGVRAVVDWAFAKLTPLLLAAIAAFLAFDAMERLSLWD